MDTSMPAELSALKPLYLTTELVNRKRSGCTILAPEDDAHRKIARRLAQGLRERTGADIPIAAQAAPDQGHVIALGRMINNPLIERLYWNRYVFTDSLCPGMGGWTIQTVHNPYPWTAGYNVIVLGGSDAEGVGLAADAFLEGIESGEDLSVPYALRVQLPEPGCRATDYVVLGRNYTGVTVPAGDLSEREARALVEGGPEESLLAFQEHAARYLITGERPYLEAGRRVLLRMCELYGADPERKMTWPEETNSRTIFAMWDAVEEAPVFTDAERLRISNMFLKFHHALIARTSDYGRLEDNDTIVWNHTTFPLMGLYWGGRYFRRYYGIEGMDVALRKAAGAFRGQEKSWKPQCDADGYLTLTIGHTIEYALAEGRMAFFESGNIRKYADYLMGIADNRGWSSGFGDSGIQRTNDIPLAGIPYAFWYTRDPRYLGYLNMVSGGSWPNPYHLDVEPEPPEDIVGVRAYPLDPQVYDYTGRRPYYNEPSGVPNIPFEQAFDKVVFRAGLGASDQYFVLDGYARGKHLHYDGNAILKFTEGGEDWLVDADYLVRNTTEHSMVSVVRDGRVEEQIPECAGLLHRADLPSFGFTETVVRDYNGVDWHRDIFWKKGDWTVVFDRMKARTEGEYRFDCGWKTLDGGEVRLLDASTLSIRRPAGEGAHPPGGTRAFFVVNASGATSTLRRRIGTPGPVALLMQRQAAELIQDDWLSFQNLLYLDSVGEEKGYRLQKLDEQAALLKASESLILGAGPLEREGVESDAALHCIGPDRVAFMDATEFRCGQVRLKSEAPFSMEIDAASGEGVVSTSVRTEIARRGEAPLLVQPGSHRIAVGMSGHERSILADLVNRPTGAGSRRTSPRASRPRSARPLEELWRVEPEAPAEEIRCAVPWNAPDRYGSDGKAKLLVCQGRKLKCYAPGSVIHWTFTTKELMRCVTTVDLDGDGRPEILCGGNDEQVHVLDNNGHELNGHRMTEQLIVGQGGTREPFVNVLLAGDFDDDGGVEIVAGCTNSQISLFDARFKRIWNRGGIYHGVRKLEAADLDGDGRLEILAADHYGSVHAIRPTGEYLGRAYSELGDVAFDVGDIDGDGAIEIVNGSGTGVTAAFGRSFDLLWQFNNYNYNTREIVCMDLDGDGNKEVVVASDTGYVYALNGEAEVRWQTDLGAPVVALSGVRTGEGGVELVAGLAGGGLMVLNTEGRIVATDAGDAPVKFVLGVDGDGTGPRQIVAVDTEERLRVLM